MIYHRTVAAAFLALIPSAAFGQSCLSELGKQSYSYDYKNCETRSDADCNFIEKNLEDYLAIRRESDIHPQDIGKYKWVGGKSHGSDSGTPVTNISAKLATPSSTYICEHNYKKGLKCGPFEFPQSTNRSFDTSFNWNRRHRDYDIEYAIYENKNYSIVGANNGVTIVDGEMKNYQPLLPNFPKAPVTSTSQEVIVLSSYAKIGGWYKTRDACSIESGSTTSHVMKMILFPSKKYSNFTQRWDSATYPRGPYCAGSGECLARMEAASKTLSAFFSQPDIIPVTLKVTVNAPAVKIDLDF